MEQAYAATIRALYASSIGALNVEHRYSSTDRNTHGGTTVGNSFSRPSEGPLVAGHYRLGETVELVSPYGHIRAERCDVLNGAIGIVAGETDGKVRVEFGMSDAANVPIHWLRATEHKGK